jgi:hypothetical protein
METRYRGGRILSWKLGACTDGALSGLQAWLCDLNVWLLGTGEVLVCQLFPIHVAVDKNHLETRGYSCVLARRVMWRALTKKHRPPLLLIMDILWRRKSFCVPVWRLTSWACHKIQIDHPSTSHYTMTCADPKVVVYSSSISEILFSSDISPLISGSVTSSVIWAIRILN